LWSSCKAFFAGGPEESSGGPFININPTTILFSSIFTQYNFFVAVQNQTFIWSDMTFHEQERTNSIDISLFYDMDKYILLET